VRYVDAAFDCERNVDITHAVVEDIDVDAFACVRNVFVAQLVVEAIVLDAYANVGKVPDAYEYGTYVEAAVAESRYDALSTYRAPVAVDFTNPRPSEERVVDPVAENVPFTVVEARVEVADTKRLDESDSAVPEALVNPSDETFVRFCPFKFTAPVAPEYGTNVDIAQAVVDEFVELAYANVGNVADTQLVVDEFVDEAEALVRYPAGFEAR
jgi:hypothetical protein